MLNKEDLEKFLEEHHKENGNFLHNLIFTDYLESRAGRDPDKFEVAEHEAVAYMLKNGYYAVKRGYRLKENISLTR